MMTIDSATFYNVQREVFERVGRDAPHARQGLINSRLAMRLNFTDVPAEITISGKTGRFEVHTGSNHLRPDFDIQLTSQTGHQVCWGTFGSARQSGMGASSGTVPSGSCRC
jgi:hypothetical protein